MSFQFKSHVPNYIDDVPQNVVEFSTWDELLTFESLKRRADGEGFVEFTKSEIRGPYSSGYTDFLISAFYEDSHWVIGYVYPDHLGKISDLKALRDTFPIRNWDDANRDLQERLSANAQPELPEREYEMNYVSENGK